MNAMNNDRYHSTKFSILSDGESLTSAKKNYLIWIITGTILFCITVAYFSFKIFVAPSFLSDENPHPHIINNTYNMLDQHRNFKLYNPSPLLAGLKKKNLRNAFEGEEDGLELETIPEIFIQKIWQKDFKNLQDFINLDLILHYENLINKLDKRSLKVIFNEYQSKLSLLKEPIDFVNFLESLKSNKFKFYARLLNREKNNLELKDFEYFFALTEELNHWYNYLHRLSSFLSVYEEQKLRKNLENCTESNFENFTEETQMRVFYFAYPFKITEKRLEEINEVVNMWSEPIKTKLYNCSVILYRKVLLLSDVNEEIRRLNVSCLKSLYVFASHFIYFDSDLELLGVNVAIVAPKWIYLKKTKINLNGISGKEFTSETASFNNSGMPGNPGENAGDFYGIGTPHEKFLVISANGGNGGKGQNGAKGPDGMNYTRPGPPVNKPACVCKMYSYKNSFGQTITHFKIFSPFGCGRSGTDGGVGGIGGTGGTITLISDSIKVIKGLNGMRGNPGRGGAGGIGGHDGCFYEVLDVNDETLHPITTVKCPTGNTLPPGKYGKDNYNTQGLISFTKKENLTMHSTLNQFFKHAGQDFVKNNNLNVILFLKNLNRLDLYNKTTIRDIVEEYKLLEEFNKIEFYEIYKEKLLKHLQRYPKDYQPLLKYLLSAVLGRILVLKQNSNFFLIDLKNYLNLVERDIQTTNEQTRELQSLSYFKKKIHLKIEDIKMNLNRIKIRTTAFISLVKHTPKKYSKNDSNYLTEEFNEKILDILTTTTDVLCLLLEPVLDDAKQIKFNSILELFSQRVTHYKNNTTTYAKSLLTNADVILLNTIENLQNNNSREVLKHLSNLKDVLCSLEESNALSNEIKNLLETFTDEMEHFVAIYAFLDWEELERSFFESLENLAITSTSDLTENEDVMFFKRRLVDAMITLQCKLAMQSAGLNLNSIENIPICHQLLQNKTIISVISNSRSQLYNLPCENTDSFCKNHFKAAFDKHSAVGEFYFWPNAEIRNKLKNLFSGSEITLKSDIINHQLFDKNFIQFRSLKLDFETETTSQKHLKDILSHFKIKMTHSGYSNYNWKGETYVFVSEKVNLEYSFKEGDNREPEIYNTLYKKCQDGEIKLSPFTTWTLRLVPIKDAIDFSNLKPFADTVNLRLIGTGTYIS